MCIRQLVFVVHNNGNIFWKKERKKLIVKKRTMQFKFMYLITTFSFGFEIQSRNLGVNVRIDGFYKIIQVNIFRILTIYVLLQTCIFWNNKFSFRYCIQCNILYIRNSCLPYHVSNSCTSSSADGMGHQIVHVHYSYTLLLRSATMS